MILDANTGAVLHDENGDELRHPASLTKMMTLYLTFETLETGRLKMTDKISISETAAGVAPSKLDLEPGEEISVSDSIRAVITKSANDIAVALAEKIGGSEANFVRLMNARARDIGMSKTHFENAADLSRLTMCQQNMPDSPFPARDSATRAHLTNPGYCIEKCLRTYATGLFLPGNHGILRCPRSFRNAAKQSDHARSRKNGEYRPMRFDMQQIVMLGIVILALCLIGGSIVTLPAKGEVAGSGDAK
jgi:hypothetical protein